MLQLIHPALVHFSIALLFLGGSSEAVALLLGRQAAERFGSRLVLLGTLSLIPTIVSGYLAANSVALPQSAQQLLGAHERNGLLLVALFGISQFWKGWYQGRLPEDQRPFFAILLLGGVALTVYGALLGGQLVYIHGVGVAAS